jgi:hypothetical protein
MKRWIWLVLLLGACGGGGGGGGASCTSAGATTCQKACACRTDGKCTILVPDGNNTDTLSLNSMMDCTSEYSLVCSNSPKAQTVDFNACEAGLAGAQCAADPNHAGEMGLALPVACAPVW